MPLVVESILLFERIAVPLSTKMPSPWVSLASDIFSKPATLSSYPPKARITTPELTINVSPVGTSTSPVR